MPVRNVYTFEYMEGGAKERLFIHGFPENERGVMCAVPYNIGNIPGEAFTPLFHIRMTSNEVQIHNGTYAHVIDVENLAAFNYVSVGIYWLYERI